MLIRFFIATLALNIAISMSPSRLVLGQAKNGTEDSIPSFDYRYEIELGTDNDFFVPVFNADQFYTYGLKANVRFIPKDPFKTKRIFKKRKWTFYEVGMNLQAFTPDAEKNELIGDGLTRPYAGWLFVEFQSNMIFERSFLELGVELGVMGPKSFAGAVQNWFHEALEFEYITGWNNQIDNQVGLNFRGMYAREIFTIGKLNSYVAPEVSLGKINTYAWPKIAFRLGRFLPIQQSGSTGNFILAGRDDREIFLELGIGVKFVGYNATIQGNFPGEDDVFNAEKINNILLTANGGVYGTYKNLLVGMSYHFLEGEVTNDSHHLYGKIKLAYKFNFR